MVSVKAAKGTREGLKTRNHVFRSNAPPLESCLKTANALLAPNTKELKTQRICKIPARAQQISQTSKTPQTPQNIFRNVVPTHVRQVGELWPVVYASSVRPTHTPQQILDHASQMHAQAESIWPITDTARNVPITVQYPTTEKDALTDAQPSRKSRKMAPVNTWLKQK